MKAFEIPQIDIITFSTDSYMLTTSGCTESWSQCNQGMQNAGYNCGDGKQVTCTGAISYT